MDADTATNLAQEQQLEKADDQQPLLRTALPRRAPVERSTAGQDCQAAADGLDAAHCPSADSCGGAGGCPAPGNCGVALEHHTACSDGCLEAQDSDLHTPPSSPKALVPPPAPKRRGSLPPAPAMPGDVLAAMRQRGGSEWQSALDRQWAEDGDRAQSVLQQAHAWLAGIAPSNRQRPPP
ncbi:hypothetical protein D9Q98_009046 [Chlorella vulgaris]|uniref:Uncharacterized protein n=1 Tax=Chlorella vulgaris TaxID=3077 RepID=A0A9D4TH20_CHLVU|nr:hypothetical protein D9Q98_009046 [Chlorella vulgaris]